jgi:hypothetical protein
MGCNMFLTMGTTKKWVPARYNDWSQMQWIILKVNEWGKPNLVCKAKEKI